MAVDAAGKVGDELQGFRGLLERAEADDGARSAALDALLERSMLVATWAGSGEALRTLRNGHGEQALGLWSGEDTLVAAALQLGWHALPTRTVDARDAIEAALAQGVQFVVVDLGSEHALELVGDEVSLLLAVKQKQQPKAAAAAQAERSTASGKSKGLVDFDLPFVHGRAEAVAEAAPDMLARAFAAPLDDGPGSKEAAQAAAPAPVAVASPPLAAQAHAQAHAQAPSAEEGSKASAGAQRRTMLGHAAPAQAAPAARPQPSEDKPAAARPAAKAPVEEAKPSAIKSAARALATMMGSGDAAAAASGSASSSGEGDGEGEAAQVFADGALRPLELGLSEAALAAIAETLRGYPEVEWACEVSDGSEVPVIGLRVSPQFMTRAGQIETAALAAGTARGAELRVLLLSEAAVMREARTHGRAFYPWKKRR